MDDRALISEINRILHRHGLEHGKRDAAFSLLWIVLSPDSTSTLTKKICEDGNILSSQHWTLSNDERVSEMKIELSHNTNI
ncbi:hypothetical protein [Phaeobacter inhibens]|uniref:hypothetical protein n=1 Tax=Phaeobacter inhibens TaxID=221822 RepID=UPI0021A28250|nr:hypothetical protein [Phaeobacter inhibens]UWS07065.1 hypothetical protein K4K98_12545 [Phaeobacter inhibens]